MYPEWKGDPTRFVCDSSMSNSLFIHLKILDTCRAASAGRVEAVRVLVKEFHAQLEAKDNEGATPLFVAAASGEKDTALFLIMEGADVEVSSDLPSPQHGSIFVLIR